MQLLSFNVNGIRAITQKSFFEDMARVNPDILCLQETKATVDQVKQTLASMDGYHLFANEAERKGYSGTAILSKTAPLAIEYGIGINEHDQEGRVITAEYPEYFLVTVYVPNSGSELARLGYRVTWDKAFLAFLLRLEQQKPVVVCGDFNVAHRDIDLSNPKANYNKYAGYMQEEIDGMNAFTSNGFVDAFRMQQPTEVKFSWWSYRAGARQRNIGWRIDYFLCSDTLMPKVSSSFLLNDVHGSDHCPVGITLEL